MAYPTGTGSEILARTTIHAQSDTATSFRWDGTMATTGTSSYTVPALHIITVLSVIATDQGSASELMNMYMNDGSNNISIISSQAIGSLGTFVWNDKFVLIGGDKLVVDTESAANVDLLSTYIDQDWS